MLETRRRMTKKDANGFKKEQTAIAKARAEAVRKPKAKAKAKGKAKAKAKDASESEDSGPSLSEIRQFCDNACAECMTPLCTCCLLGSTFPCWFLNLTVYLSCCHELALLSKVSQFHDACLWMAQDFIAICNMIAIVVQCEGEVQKVATGGNSLTTWVWVWAAWMMLLRMANGCGAPCGEICKEKSAKVADAAGIEPKQLDVLPKASAELVGAPVEVTGNQ